MNKKLIKDNKEAFDYWLNGGKLLIRNNDENIWINMTEVHWDMNHETVSIIINDEFSELRKALCYEKTIDVYEYIKSYIRISHKGMSWELQE